MKGKLTYLVLVLGVTVYWASSSDILTNKILSYRLESQTPIIRVDRSRYGDLFGRSYLSDFKILRNRISEVPLRPCKDGNNIIDLYAMCDSYLWGYVGNDSFYCGVDKLHLIRTNNREKVMVKLDSTKTNILLIQCVERSFRDLIARKYMQTFISLAPEGIDTNIIGVPQATVPGPEGHSLFNEDIDKNIELNVWESDIFTPIKMFKADLNYNLFNRLDDQVVVSTNGARLFYAPTIDTTDTHSSFQRITNSEIRNIVNELNNLYQKYKSSGFEEVYLSIIPNPVSIYDRSHRGLVHNNLIERVYASPDLMIPVIDINTIFKNSSMDTYYPADTHWNMTGAYLWVNEVNKRLSEHYNRPAHPAVVTL